MKIFTTPAVMAMLAGTAFAHSWLDCVDTRVSNLAAAQANPAGVPMFVIPVPRSCACVDGQNSVSRNA